MNEFLSTSSRYSRGPNTAASTFNVLMGIWLIISTFALMAFNNLPSARWNNVIVGILVGLFGLVRTSTNAPACWSWSNLVLGIWLIISPFVLGFSYVFAAMWHNVIAGIVVGVLAWIRAFSPAEVRTT